MTGVKDMTAPGGRLTCDLRGCKNTFVSEKNKDRHIKEKHEQLLAGTSKQTTNTDVQVILSQDPLDLSPSDEEAIQEAKDDQDLYDELERLENEMKDDNSEFTRKIVETLEI